jgi:3-deoxy-D-manno-octulosonic-acid transferase
VDQIAAQTENDAQRAVALGADASRVEVVGNLKFDLEEHVQTQTLNLGLQTGAASQQGVWLAGSTHEGEDEIVLNVHADLVRNKASRLLILAPRHPERFEPVYQMCCSRFPTQKRSELFARERLKNDTRVLLLDSIGELSQFIAISDWAFIGGSLVPVGGHNILEACQAGVPVIFGEFMSNFTQIAQIVRDENAGIQVSDQSDLLQACLRLSGASDTRATMGKNGLALVQANQGASQRTLKLLAPWLSI